jgi:hypothetical protein
LARAAIVPAQQPADTPSNTSDQKTKKVWTNDDFAPGSASAAPTAKEADLPRRSTDHANAQLASQLRGKLEKLQAQWKDAAVAQALQHRADTRTNCQARRKKKTSARSNRSNL